VLGVSVLPFLYNVFRSYRFGDPAGADDPWGFGNSPEWATSSPPPRHDFTELPRIRSERPAFELHQRMREESHYSVTKRDQGDVGVDKTTDQVIAPADRETEHG
jgi:cytochrome c oxidase subunit 1